MERKKEIIHIYFDEIINYLSIIEKIQIYDSVWKPEIKISINVNPTTNRTQIQVTIRILENIHDQMEFDTLFERIGQTEYFAR